jgi:hypothetical protein
LLQTPLTYRGAPLGGGDAWLVGTADHSVLGRRWVYDARGDPVYASVLASTIITGAGQAEEYIEIDGRLERRESTTFVRGGGAEGADVPTISSIVGVDDGDPTVILTDSVELVVMRILSGPGNGRASGELALTGTWSGQTTQRILAHARPLERRG